LTKSLAGRVALITGASRRIGIGAAIAREFATSGANLFLTHYAPYDAEQEWGIGQDEPQELVDELRAYGVNVVQDQADLSQPTEPDALMARAVNHFGHIDILVNNATYSQRDGIDGLNATEIDRAYAINLRSPMLLCAAFARQHANEQSGHIINITSGQGHGPMPGELAYVATKGGIDALTVTLSAELAPRGITVNAVDPGVTDTGWIPPELKRSFEEEAPMGRVGVPSDAARLVRFLASDDARWITGQIIRSRGGL
jgi:3-oxoacyl-[acyl-carrier protein] reductase